jgi:hypothetical protein
VGEALVWYAAYGSNVDRQRFLTYLTGGTVAGAADLHGGARDPTPPREERPYRFSRPVRFALRSRRWDGAIALLDHQVAEPGALGRRYLITAAQLADVVAQENHRPTTDLPLAELTRDEIHALSDRTYDGLLLVDHDGGVPVVTFTSPRDPVALAAAAPSAAYLATIARGIRATHDMTAGDVARMLHSAPGVAPAWSIEGIVALMQ